MSIAVRAPRAQARDAGLRRYLQQVNAFPLLRPEEERTFAQQVRNNDDALAMSRLSTSHLRLVVKVARHYNAFGLPMSELIAEGNLGMVGAIRALIPIGVLAYRPSLSGPFGRRSRNTCSATGR
jgi:RNA polymerase sigma-32 factor